MTQCKDYKKGAFNPQKIVDEAAKQMKDIKEPLVKSPVKVPVKDS